MDAGTGRARRRTVVGAIAVAAALVTSGCAAGRVAQTIRQTPAIDGVNASSGPIAVRYLSIIAPTGLYYPAGAAVQLTGVFVNQGTTPDQLVGISTAAFSGWGAYGSIAAGNQVVSSSTASSSATSSPTASESAADSPSGSPSGSPASGPASGSGSGSASGSGSSSASSSTASSAASSAQAPAASRSVSIPTGGRVSYGVPEATGSLVLTGATSKIYPGTQIRVTFTFARAGQVTVNVPVQITQNPVQATIPAPSGSGGN